MTPTESLLIDTNVLIYAMDEASLQHKTSRALLETAESPDAMLCVPPQVLAEFFSLVTNPKRVTTPKSVEEALEAIESILSLPGLEVLPVPLDVVSRWIALCRKHPVKGAGIYDLQIVAVMLANGVQRICTFDTSDFQPFAEIQVQTP